MFYVTLGPRDPIVKVRCVMIYCSWKIFTFHFDWVLFLFLVNRLVIITYYLISTMQHTNTVEKKTKKTEINL